MTICDKIKARREELQLTQDQAAALLGVGRTTYSYWEKTTPKLEVISKIEDAFGLTRGYFLDKNFGEQKSIEKGYDQDNYKEKYIRNLEEQTKFLQRMLESSLGSIAEVQLAQLSHQKALAWYQAYNQAGRDPNRTLDELATLNSKVAEYAGMKLEKDTVTNT